MTTRSYRDLEVWQLAMEIVEVCYRITAALPVEERYGLKSQIRRAAVSIAANVAEGRTRQIKKPYRNHVSIALGSQAELETLLEIAVRLRFLPAASVVGPTEQLSRVGRMLHGLHRSLRDADEDC